VWIIFYWKSVCFSQTYCVDWL
jgi:hypothetical protein